jgi:predicted RNase H-like HicB family nuclease
MQLTIEYEQEEDGRWLAEVPQLPGVVAYGATPAEAMSRAQALALRVLAERLENNESPPVSIRIDVPLPA